MTWILWALVGAAAVHVAEEFLWPGGFLRQMREIAPPALQVGITPLAGVVINALMFVVMVGAALIGPAQPALSLSGAALCFLNCWMHVGASLRVRHYVPGVISGVGLYLPLSITAYALYAQHGSLSLSVVLGSLALGVVYQAVPPLYFLLRGLLSPPAPHPVARK